MKTSSEDDLRMILKYFKIKTNTSSARIPSIDLCVSTSPGGELAGPAMH